MLSLPIPRDFAESQLPEQVKPGDGCGAETCWVFPPRRPLHVCAQHTGPITGLNCATVHMPGPGEHGHHEGPREELTQGTPNTSPETPGHSDLPGQPTLMGPVFLYS